VSPETNTSSIGVLACAVLAMRFVFATYGCKSVGNEAKNREQTLLKGG